MFRHKHIKLAAGLALAACLFLTGCSPSFSTGTKSQEYAQRHFGEAEFIAQEDRATSVIRTYKDTEYEFEYDVTDSAGINSENDGSLSLGYVTVTSNFEQKYYEHAIESLNENIKAIQDEYACVFTPADSSYDFSPSAHGFGVLTCMDRNQIVKAAEAIGLLFQTYDTRDHWTHGDLDVCTLDSKSDNPVYAGCYRFECSVFLDAESALTGQWTYRAKALDSGASFLRKETLQKDAFLRKTGKTATDFAELSDDIDLYYFKSEEGEEFYISTAMTASARDYFTDYKK